MYRPQLVILAYISDDLQRSMLGYYFYKKPLFKLNENELVLTNTPIGSPEEVLSELRMRYGRFFPLFWLWLEEPHRYKYSQAECFALNSRILEKTLDCAQMNHAEFLLVNLACGFELQSETVSTISEDFMDAFLAKRQVQSVKTHAKFLEAGGPWTEGHYKTREVRLVAEAVYAKIKELDAWRHYEQHHPADNAKNE